ncbi:DUF3515 domain-containing protein [Streptomyces hiroshimensis]|uniref:DUF3515 domain-containing protein n=1 Tax=Streptomyces hiroshimensis TaxID=66424 RepID=A0ABQ2Z7Y1_9ACTN|nr:DUF3515 domain-containing protein [Streptomyces hiroshimensis]GGY07544.1 hypothetical protein GCM10010324_62930 [Streptomyces hiroshimensis]
MQPWIRRLRGLPVVVALLVAAGSSSTGGAAARAVPRPTGQEAAHCRALHAELPAALAGLERGTSGPVSEFTADWGDPAVVLRCGIPHPDVLTVGSKSFDRYASAWEIGGIEWFPVRLPDGGVRCIAIHRAAFVEVVVPKEYGGDGTGQTALAELGPLIVKAVPEGYV